MGIGMRRRSDLVRTHLACPSPFVPLPLRPSLCPSPLPFRRLHRLLISAAVSPPSQRRHAR
eukprot:3302461-Pyramimonas_sp.AAC.1